MAVTGAQATASTPKSTQSQNLMKRRIIQMKTLSKKILTSCLALMMAVIMALPTFALTVGSTRKIYGWNGQTVNGSKAALTSMGYNSRVQVQTGNTGNQQWT